MSEYTKHEDQMSKARHYEKYKAEYNFAFAADPDPTSRKFDESADANAKQWARLETFRGNDESAYRAHQTNPTDPYFLPNDKEQEQWAANDADKWAIGREPAYGLHEGTNNKWLDMSLEDRRSFDKGKGQSLLAAVDKHYGPKFEDWAEKAGSNRVVKETFLQGLAVVGHEKQQASQQAQALTQQQPTAQQQATPATQQAVSSEAQPVKRTQLDATAFTQQSPAPQPHVPTRINLDQFDLEKRGPEMKAKSDTEIQNVMDDSQKMYAQVSQVSISEGIEKGREFREHREEAQVQSRTQSQTQVHSQVQQQTRVQSQ